MTEMTELEKARESINSIDRDMAKLFEARMQAVSVIAAYKKENGLPIEDLKREAALIEKNSACITEDSLLPYYTRFLRQMIELSKEYQNRLCGSSMTGSDGEV